MDSVEFSKFRHDSVHALMRLNDTCDRTFKVLTWPRWDYDLDAGTLTFSQDGIASVVASILVVGTSSVVAGTWLWSWANDCFPENVVAPVRRVKEFGVAEGLSELTESSPPDDEYLGWAMTAIAARILEAKGAYRCPRDEGGYTYLLYTDLAFADQAKRLQDKAKIDCDRHGRGYATYICEHLLAQPAQKWFSNAPHEEDPWPDAWCGSCESLFQEQGEWNKVNEKRANIKVLCHCCYGKLRTKAHPVVQ